MTKPNGVPSFKSARAAELATLAKDGSEDAFSLLAELFSPDISRLLSSLIVPDEEKEDLRQEALLGLYKAVHLYDPALSSFYTFGVLCIRSAVTDGVRRYARRTPSRLFSEEEMDCIPADGTGEPERILLGKEDLAALLGRSDALLSPMERRIFGMSLGGVSCDEIAKKLGKDGKSIHNALYRIRKKLSALSSR